MMGTADPKSARIAGGSDAIPFDAATGVVVGGCSVCCGGATVFIVCGSRGSIVPKRIKPFILSYLFANTRQGQNNDNELQGAST